MRPLLAVALIVGMAVSSPSQQAPLQKYVGESLLPVLEALDDAELSGSLAFSGKCATGFSPDLPEFRTRQLGETTLLHGLRTTLPDHPTLQVTQDGDGMIRMIEPGVPVDILSVKISHISFREARYDPNLALSDILQAPEVVAFMEAHSFEGQFRGHGGGATGNRLGKWPLEAPHISGSLDNLTLGEALNAVLKTFPGIWVYENCSASGGRNRDVYLGFFRLDYWGSKPIIIQ